VIVLEAVHESNAEESTSRKYVKELKMPEGVLRDQLASSYSAEGILTISAPRVIKAPEGAEVKESMAAASKAFTTDDGRTSVKQDSQQASQQIATSTVSADGTSKSSMSFSSSSSSSMTSTSSSSGGPMPSLMGDMGSMMGGGQMALDMDMESMMAKMKGDMKLGGGSMMGGDMSKMMSSMSSSKMSSSSFSSSSSSSSTTQMGSTMLGRGMEMPSLGNMGGIGSLDIEELSTAGTDFTGPPEYTVTSPRPSVVAGNVAGEMKHRVQAAADYKAADSKEADHTVLLKLKEGDEYKLVLNMQSYSPENITVKLNDDASVLTVSATANPGSTDDFKQTHKVPEGIDLDQMTSSFSSDGILVIKAPRKK